MTGAVRRVVYSVHLYAGLGVGLFVAFVCATGSLAVFRPELDRLLHAETYAVAPKGERVPAEVALAVAKDAYPGGPPGYAHIRLPDGPEGTFRVLMKDGFREADQGPWVMASIDPYTGTLVAARLTERTLTGRLINLHANLLAGEHSLGETVVGVGGLLLLLFCLTGIVLWWPGMGRVVSSLRIRRGRGVAAVNLDLHRVLGVVALAPLVVLALTGVTLVFRPQVAPLYKAVLHAPSPPRPPASTPVPGRTRIPVDDALRAAERAAPGTRAVSVQVPGGARASYAVRMKAATDRDQRYGGGGTVVYVDQYRGDVLAVHRAAEMPVASRLLHEWLFPTHTGEIAGTTGRLVAFLAGLAPAVLFVTGVVVWWGRRRARSARR